MKRTLNLVLLAAVAAAATPLAAVAANDGSTEDKAIQLTAKTIEQKQPIELFERGTNGICFLKMKLSKGKAYTVWLEKEPGVTAAITETYPQLGMDLDFNKNPPSADFECVQNGTWQGWVMSGEHWERVEQWDDQTGEEFSFTVPNTWTYVIVVRGAIGEKATCHYIQANALPEGFLQNPKVLVPEREEKVAEKLQFYSPDYHLKVDFEAGRRYYLATGGGTEANPFRFTGLPEGTLTNSPAWTAGAYDEAKVFIPKASGTSIFAVSTLASKTNDFEFASVRYRVDPVRKPEEHSPVTLEEGVAVDFSPGHLNAWDSGAYDPIIDERLFKFTAAKKTDYVVQASWKASAQPTNLLMRLYDKDGKVLQENRGDGSGLNVRCVITNGANKAVVFYIGVCQDLGVDDDWVAPVYGPAEIAVTAVSQTEAEPVALNPAPVDFGTRPLAGDPEGQTVEGLSAGCWYRTLTVNARKGFSYEFFPMSTNEVCSELTLAAELYRHSGKKDVLVDAFDFTPGAGSVAFKATETTTYSIRFRVTEGLGLDYPSFQIHSIGSAPDQDGQPVQCGRLLVSPMGAEGATWTIAGEKISYAAGESVLLPTGVYTVKYSAVKDYSKPDDREVAIYANEECLVDDGRYSDTYDPKDDFISGKAGSVKYAATSWTLKTSETFQSRTLWENDEADNFSFTAKDGYYYDFRFAERSCDAVIGITDAAGASVVAGQTEVSRLALSAGKYFLTVVHAQSDPEKRTGGSYVLAGSYANVGAIKFAKAAVTVKDTDTSLKLTVKRTAKDGSVKVRWTTEDGTATAGWQFYAANGVLSWANGDNKDKTVTVRLIPKPGAWYNDGNRTFAVRLADASEAGDYDAKIIADTCTVTVKETSKESVTRESVYAKKAAKKATVSKSETVGIETGTFYGVLDAGLPEAGGPTNGLPRFASVTLTTAAATAKKAASLTAKVALGGKTYTFKAADGWDEEGANCRKKLVLVTKVAKVSYTNELVVTLAGGASTSNAWAAACGKVTLAMNVPDANNKGVQAGIKYAGRVFRQNAKVQGYLDEMVKFAGYYTMALTPLGGTRTVSGASLHENDAAPGSGYLTVKVDNKGKATIAGLLADGTKISLSVTASAIERPEPDSRNLVLPVYQAKSPFVLGGTVVIRLADGTPVVDGTASALVWNNDNAGLSYDGHEGRRFDLVPTGGWYDTILNLQSYYRENDYVVDTADEFPKETLPAEMSAVPSAASPNGYPVLLAGDAVSLDKRSLTKAGKLYDFAQSINPCNLQIKLARATGVVTGSFAIWAQNADGTKQSEVKGFSHAGICLLSRDGTSPLSPQVLTAGACRKELKLTETVNGKSKTRKWSLLAPFDIKEEDR